MSNSGGVKIRYSQASKDSIKSKPEIHDKLEEFLTAKTQDPMQPFGKTDTRFIASGPIGKTGLKLRHAHLSQNVSVIYRLHGSNPKLLDIYGVMTHKELGTSTTANIRTQKKVAKKFTKQQF